MALTKEQRKQRAADRDKQREELARRLPNAQLHRDYGKDEKWVQVNLRSGERDFLTIRVLGQCFKLEGGSLSQTYPVQTATIRLDTQPHALAELIRGLTLRYNAIIEEMNFEVENTPALERAKTFEAGE